MGREDVWRIRDDRSLNLSWSAKLVWLILESRGENCGPSLTTIAADCGISKRTAIRAIKELAAKECLKVSTNHRQGGGQTTNGYTTKYPGLPWGARQSPPIEGECHTDTGVGCHTDTGVGSDSHGGGVSQSPQEEEKGSVKEKCKKTPKTSSSEQSPDGGPKGVEELPGPDAPGTRPEVDRICDNLAGRVEELTGRRPPITVTGWRRPARYMLDVDGMTEQQVHQAIKFAAEDEFWAPNIRSVSKLREKIPQLRAAAARKGRPGGADRHQQNTAAAAAYLAAVDEYESRNQPERTAIES